MCKADRDKTHQTLAAVFAAKIEGRADYLCIIKNVCFVVLINFWDTIKYN